MRRKGFVAGVCILSTLLMGVAYAAWTNKLTISNHVGAGELKIKFADTSMYGAYGNDCDGENVDWTIYYSEDKAVGVNSSRDNVNQDVPKPEGYNKYTTTSHDIVREAPTLLKDELPVNADITNRDKPYGDPNYTGDTQVYDKINVTLKDMYPGFAQIFRTDIFNLGTVAAKLASCEGKIVSTSSEIMKSELGIAVLISREESKTGNDGDVINAFNESGIFANAEENFGETYEAKDFFTIGSGNKQMTFLRLSALDKYNLTTNMKEEHNELLVLPNTNRYDVYWAIAMDPDVEGKYTSGHALKTSGVLDSRTELESIDFTLDLMFDQFNITAPTSVNE